MRRGDTRGFTLIEVLVAFTIAVVLLVPLLHSFSTGLNSTSRTDRYTEAAALARSTFESLGRNRGVAATGHGAQKVGLYQISTTVRPYQGEGAVAGPAAPAVPYDVAVTVAWRDGRRTQSIELHGVRLGPAPDGETAP